MQQLVRDGSTVDDIAELEFPDHLQLVLLPATGALTPMVESAFYDACAANKLRLCVRYFRLASVLAE